MYNLVYIVNHEKTFHLAQWQLSRAKISSELFHVEWLQRPDHSAASPTSPGFPQHQSLALYSLAPSASSVGAL